MRRVLGGLVILGFVFSGCGGSEDDAEPTAESAARVLKAEIGEITELVVLNEDNDPNDLLGRPNGYVAAAVLLDSRVSCDTDDPGVDCGATIEQWPSRKAAEERSDYIQTLQSGSSLFGSEWNTVRGELLLRVTGEMKPSAAKAYGEIFESADLAADVDDETAAGSASPTAVPWELVDSGFGAAHGYAWAIARIQNRAEHGGQTVTVNFNLRDESGALVASGSQVSHFSWADQVLPVATQVEVPKGKRAHAVEATVVVADDGTFDDQTSDNWGTYVGTIYKPEYSEEYGARFEVQNPTDEPLEGSSFQVVCTNRAGKIIGGASHYPELIPASGSVLVDVASLYTTKKPAECTGYLAPWM
jgi:hypothetical protein